MKESGFESWSLMPKKRLYRKILDAYVSSISMEKMEEVKRLCAKSRSPPGSNFLPSKREWWLHVATPWEGETLGSERFIQEGKLSSLPKSLRKGSWEPGRFFKISLPGVTQADFPSATFEGFIGSIKEHVSPPATRGHSRAAGWAAL